jgi:molecular chaperone GrpE (heat shock protein)
VTPEPNSVFDPGNTVGREPDGGIGGIYPQTDTEPANAAADPATDAAGPVIEVSTQLPASTQAAAPGREALAGADMAGDAETEVPATAAGESAPDGEDLLAGIAANVREIAGAADRYHARAEQREGVIDYLRSELDVLRRGERRGLLRPVLAELCRLRDDLLKQAASLPADFGADKAADLLRSYAETIELTLESNGVVTYAPDNGDSFNPRMHRRISGEPTADPELAGHVAGIQRDGYLDIEANSPIAPAEVTVYAVTRGEQEQ